MKILVIYLVVLIRIMSITTTTIDLKSDNDFVTYENIVNESENNVTDNGCNFNYDNNLTVDVIYFDKHLNETAVDQLDEMFSIFSDNDVNKKFKRNVQNDIPRPDQRSLLIIFDGTASMHDDLKQLKNSAKQIIAELSLRTDNPIFNYVLVIFRDPGKGHP